MSTLPISGIVNERVDDIECLEPVYRDNDKGFPSKIAEGFELIETVGSETDGETICWEERRLIVCSIKYKEAQEKSLNKRLKKAKKDISELTRPRSGYKCIKTKELFWPAVNDILKRYNVEGLLDIDAQESIIEHCRRGYRGKPARVEIQQVINVQVQDNEVALKAAINRLGWRVYATNAPIEKLLLDDAMLIYREEYFIERGFGRLKGKY